MSKGGLRNKGLDEEVGEEDQDRDIYTSTKKPTKTQVPTRKGKVNKDDYWTVIPEARKAFQEQGFSFDMINTDLRESGQAIYHQNFAAEAFFRKVDTSKSPLKGTIGNVYRDSALEYYVDKDGNEKSRSKEFLCYNIELSGSDYLGNSILCRLEGEGRCYSPNKKVEITIDHNTGEENAEYKMQGTRWKYYIPWSKSTLDKLLQKYDTPKENVKFYARYPIGGHNNVDRVHRVEPFTYEQIINESMDDLKDISKKKLDEFYAKVEARESALKRQPLR